MLFLAFWMIMVVVLIVIIMNSVVDFLMNHPEAIVAILGMVVLFAIWLGR